jgi:hypothetical protein
MKLQGREPLESLVLKKVVGLSVPILVMQMFF